MLDIDAPIFVVTYFGFSTDEPAKAITRSTLYLPVKNN
jgi:hypothetical protein